ncbi:LemA family protein [Sphingomicrobium astaxanthinifaciens]|uniref:LemA family protein n=1 Tax=Sphingomicrobium astaxanthinifaciens TaxID=1227949 RepID=UPI001FCB93AB|nr:LemA family protein [Sphingomicrobium astaxanthinifaciens]MCJ7421890.1 LemA family protein [Sphingomicrobium astaxanthinifaciens]
MTMRRTGLFTVLVAASLAGCGINSVPTAEEEVNAAWGNVEAEYQRRNDLIGNLVESVKAAAGSEEDILTQITEARASATSTNLSTDQLDNPEAVRAYAQAQGQLANARSLLGTVIMERYPELASQQRFADLMVQLEGTENSILVARRDYNDAVRNYNTTIRTFPDAIGAKIIHGAEPKVPFEAAAGADEAVEVDFGA